MSVCVCVVLFVLYQWTIDCARSGRDCELGGRVQICAPNDARVPNKSAQWILVCAEHVVSPAHAKKKTSRHTENYAQSMQIVREQRTRTRRAAADGADKETERACVCVCVLAGAKV